MHKLMSRACAASSAPKFDPVSRCAEVLLCVCLLGGSAAAHANDVLTGTRSRHPLTALIGIPDAASRSASADVHLSLLHANAFMGGAGTQEVLLLDGESTELALTWHQPVSACTAVSARLPVLAHGGGVFDAAIETWHDWFGLPNGGRENAPRDALSFRHITPEGVHELTHSAAGLGDVTVAVQHLWGCEAQPASRSIPLRFGLKLPSGDESRWLGSGGLDIWADVQTPVFSPHRDVRLAASLGLVLPGETERLPTLVSTALFGAVGVQYQLTPQLRAHASFDWHTALFDGELRETADASGQLTAGFSLYTDPETWLDVQITEDVFIDTSNDISLRIAYRKRLLR